MQHDPSHLGSWILIWIIGKKPILNVVTKFVEDHETGIIIRSTLILQVRNFIFCELYYLYYIFVASLARILSLVLYSKYNGNMT